MAFATVSLDDSTSESKGVPLIYGDASLSSSGNIFEFQNESITSWGVSSKSGAIQICPFNTPDLRLVFGLLSIISPQLLNPFRKQFFG